MALVTDTIVKDWIDSNIKVGYGDGDGDGYGYGSGYGYGDGDGDGSGDGYGYGDGDGYGFKSFCGLKIYYIDNLPTVFYHIVGNFAKGATIDTKKLALNPCIIAKSDGYFAHGATVADAAASLQTKILQSLPTEERIKNFVSEHPAGVKRKGKDYYIWHNLLTGSCKFGRDQFVAENNIDLEAEYTPEEFIEIVKNAYGSDIITQLKKQYEQ